jgi:tRNA 2-thiouridine synthesizing protein A
MRDTACPAMAPLDWDAAQTVDARGLPCPQPLLAMRRALRGLPEGGLLRVLATDPASQRDFQSYAKLSGQPLLRIEQQGEVYSFWLRRAKSSIENA